MSPRYYNTLTQEIVDYPAEAAALFDILKPVPSERNTVEDESTTPNKVVEKEIKSDAK